MPTKISMMEKKVVRFVAEVHENAEKDYIAGMKYKDIAEKYGVKLDTVKSWKTRYGWIRGNKKSVHTKKEKVCTQKKIKPEQLDEVEIDTEEKSELSEKTKLFCVYFVKSFNATRAYMKAYGCDYQSAATSASRLLKNVKVQEYIRELKSQRAALLLFEKEDLVQKYMDIAFADMHEFAELDKGGTGIRIQRDYDGSVVGEIKETKFGISIKLNDRMKAMEWLGRYFEANPEAERKKEYDMLKLQVLKQEYEENKRKKKLDEENKQSYGVVMLAPVLEAEEEEMEDERNMDTPAEAD